MGQAKRRGTFEQRYQQAIESREKFVRESVEWERRRAGLPPTAAADAPVDDTKPALRYPTKHHAMPLIMAMTLAAMSGEQ